MKKKRFSVEQIVGVLKQAEVGIPLVEVIRKAWTSEQTFYRWKAKCIGLEVGKVRQRKPLQVENLRLKQLVAELTRGKAMLQDMLPPPANKDRLQRAPALKKMVKPSRCGSMIEHAAGSYYVSERRACKVLCVARATHSDRSHLDPRV